MLRKEGVQLREKVASTQLAIENLEAVLVQQRLDNEELESRLQAREQEVSSLAGENDKLNA